MTTCIMATLLLGNRLVHLVQMDNVLCRVLQAVAVVQPVLVAVRLVLQVADSLEGGDNENQKETQPDTGGS